jgi:hypothetical protein
MCSSDLCGLTSSVVVVRPIEPQKQNWRIEVLREPELRGLNSAQTHLNHIQKATNRQGNS